MNFKDFHEKEKHVALSLDRELVKLDRIEVVIKTPSDIEYELQHFEYSPKDLKLIIKAKRCSPVETM